MSKRNKITNKIDIIMVSFYSEKMINKCLKNIPSDINIIIVNNAINDPLKSKISKRRNLKVVTPEKNLGNGGGVNFGLKISKKKYAMYLDVDTTFKKNIFRKLVILAEKTQNWSIIAPNLLKYNYRKKNFVRTYNNDFFEMKFVEGCALLFNIKKIKHLGFYDEKIFLYYEEDDLFFRYRKNGFKVLMSKNVFISHKGNSSVNEKFSYEIELNRNWHIMWSKFYYFKKNYSYFYGILKTFKNFFSSIIKSLIYYLINNNKYKIYFYRMNGLWNSYLGNKSFKRPNL